MKKLSEINNGIKYKILKFDIPNCKFKYMQVGPDWIKFVFNKNDRLTFGLKFSEFMLAALENPRMDASLENHAETGKIRHDFSKDENAKYVEYVFSNLINAADSVKIKMEDLSKYTIQDPYGISQLLTVLEFPTFPENIKDIDGYAYTFGSYDPISESEKWYPAIQPVGYFAKQIAKSKDAASYDDYNFPLTGFIDNIEKRQMEQ